MVHVHPHASYCSVLLCWRFFRRLIWRSDTSSRAARRTAFTFAATFAFLPPIRERLRAAAIFFVSFGILRSFPSASQTNLSRREHPRARPSASAAHTSTEWTEGAPRPKQPRYPNGLTVIIGFIIGPCT